MYKDNRIPSFCYELEEVGGDVLGSTEKTPHLLAAFSSLFSLFDRIMFASNLALHTHSPTIQAKKAGRDKSLAPLGRMHKIQGTHFKFLE